VIDVVGGEELVYHVQVPLVDNLLNETAMMYGIATYAIVLFRHRAYPSSVWNFGGLALLFTVIMPPATAWRISCCFLLTDAVRYAV
jgi:hypothetical protein